MMEPADLRKCDHRSPLGRYDRAGFRAIHGQPQMCPSAVIIVKIAG
jgi:hypothetical protein